MTNIKRNSKVEIQKTFVEIFKTDVATEEQAQSIKSALNLVFPDYTIHFDLEDCDKVLKICSFDAINPSEILNFGIQNNVQIEIIEN